MVRCILCSNLIRKTRKCIYYSEKKGKDIFVAGDFIHKDIPCDGYTLRKDSGDLEVAVSLHRMGDISYLDYLKMIKKRKD